MTSVNWKKKSIKRCSTIKQKMCGLHFNIFILSFTSAGSAEPSFRSSKELVCKKTTNKGKQNLTQKTKHTQKNPPWLTLILPELLTYITYYKDFLWLVSVPLQVPLVSLVPQPDKPPWCQPGPGLPDEHRWNVTLCTDHLTAVWYNVQK